VSATFSKTAAVQVALKDAISTVLVLQNNGGDDLAITEPGTFAFSTPVKSGAPYAVTIKTQPDGRLCSVVDAQGNASLLTSPKVYVTCMNLVQTDDGFVMVSKLAAGASASVGGSYKTSAPSASQATTAQASEQFLYVPSRPDAVHVFRINADGTLVEQVAPYTHPYDGFRPHFRMSADGKVAYFAHQLRAQLVIGLSVDELTGALTQTGTVEMQMSDARTIHLSPSGKAVYVQGSRASDVCPQWSLTGTCLVAEIGLAVNSGGQFVQLGEIGTVPGSISPAGGTSSTFRTAHSIAHFGRNAFYYPTVGAIHRYQILPQGGASSEGLSYVDYVQNLSGSLDPQWGIPNISGRLYVDRSGNRLYQVFSGYDANYQQLIPGALLEPQIGIHSIAADGGLGPLTVLSGTSQLPGLCPAGSTPSYTQTWLTPPVEDVRGNFLYTSQTVTTNCLIDGSGDAAPRREVGIFAYDISGGIENAKLIQGSPFYPGKLHPSALLLIRHPTQDWLYAPNQDGGSIDGYRISTTTGALTKMQGSPFGTAKSPGTGESLVKIDATGKFLYLMAPLEVFAFAIDQTTGALSLIGSYPLTVQ
jgi:6-phosphogluconolactonase (cycloisomerase 2 family)